MTWGWDFWDFPAGIAMGVVVFLILWYVVFPRLLS